MATGSGGDDSVSTTEIAMKRVAYYKGCLASLSAKELDSATQALAPKVGLELVELESQPGGERLGRDVELLR